MSCRIVAKCKSAKQCCRKLAYGQRLARPTSLRGRLEKAFCLALVHGAVKWSRQLDRWVCGFGACQGCQTDQCKLLPNCKGWPARGILKAQKAFSLEVCEQEARRLVWLGLDLNGHKSGAAWWSHWVRFGNLSSQICILWRSCFWDRLAVSVLEPHCGQLYVFLLPGAACMNETSSGYIFLVCRAQRCGFALVSLWAMYLCLRCVEALRFPPLLMS